MPSFAPIGTPVMRSKEAPMQWDYEKPRTFPGSPFHHATATAVGRRDESSGEPTRKRTHYDAMEVDTPPRPAVVEHQSTDAKSRTTTVEPESLGLRSTTSTVVTEQADTEGNDKSLVMIDAFIDDDHADRTDEGVRRRRRRSLSRKDDDTRHEGDSGNAAAASLFGQGKEFSFQVHHHHAASQPFTHASVADQSMSRILLGYVQLASISLLSLLVLSLLTLFLYTLYTDISTRLAAMTIELRAEILACAKAYVDNRCEPVSRIPAMEERCAAWEECMRREVIVHGKTKVVAETLAEIVNGFVEVISFRTMVFLVGFLSSLVYVSSFALSLLPKPKERHFPVPSPHYIPVAQHGYQQESNQNASNGQASSRKLL